ncbi:hypothetical protein ACP70R_006490 [Stipagrostis hirtigluma subsp. patula]
MAAAVAVRRAGGRFLLARAGDNGFLAASRALAEGPDVDAPPAAAGGREPAASAMAARVTPAVLFVTVVLAVVLLASGLMHVLRRLFLKSHHAGGGGAERQRQLQHLFFPAHEEGGGGGGLDQAAIDALPEFAYAELSGAAAAACKRAGKGKAAAAADADSSRPFDCAVCLCEFAGDDRLRLLPLCGHAFHVACIDVWLRSSATCPLCRTKLSARHLAAAAAAPDTSSAEPDIEEAQHMHQEAPCEATAAATVVLPVRLGRFKNTTAVAAGDDAEASTSASSRIDGRRCYSMGSYQYVLSDEQLLVSVHVRNGNAGAGVPAAGGDDQQGKKVFARGDSFSVSKIWQRRGSDKRLPSLCACGDDGLPWAPPAKDQSNACTTRQQESDT